MTHEGIPLLEIICPQCKEHATEPGQILCVDCICLNIGGITAAMTAAANNG